MPSPRVCMPQLKIHTPQWRSKTPHVAKTQYSQTNKYFLLKKKKNRKKVCQPRTWRCEATGSATGGTINWYNHFEKSLPLPNKDEYAHFLSCSNSTPVLRTPDKLLPKSSRQHAQQMFTARLFSRDKTQGRKRDSWGSKPKMAFTPKAVAGQCLW